MDKPRFNLRSYLATSAAALRLSAAEVGKFPNRLRDPAPYSPRLPSAWRLVVGLLILALLPRWFMAERIPTICTDGTMYVDLAARYEAGANNDFEDHGRNPYPYILAALHACGLSWEAAGKTWGVLCGTLVVLPLFGWVRRQFNDRVATVACILYAAHAELIEWSPELVRDQTFWLLFTTSLYCIWRATVEVNVAFHFACGLLLPLCVLSRFEGVFLVIPYAGWAIARLRYLQENRLRMLAGTAAFLVVPLTGLFIVNRSMTDGRSWDRAVYSAPWQRAQAWWTGKPAGAKPSIEIAGTLGTDLTPAQHNRAFLRTMVRGLSEVNGVLLFLGLLLHARLFFRSDHLPVFFTALAITAGVWIHLWYSGGLASSRYGLPIVIMGTRCAAVALMRGIDVLPRLLASRPEAWRTATALAPLVVVILVGWIDALTTRYESREIKAELGRWICRTYGENCRLAGIDSQLGIVGFYAQAHPVILTSEGDAAQLVRQIEQFHPDVLILSAAAISDEAYARVCDAGKNLGLEPTQPEMNVRLRAGTIVLSTPPLRR